jgi:hypothetical protein
MNMDLQSYVKIYNNWIDSNTCDGIVDQLDSNLWTKHTYYNPNDDKSVNVNGDKEFDYSYVITSSPYVMNRMVEAVDKYIIDVKIPWTPILSDITEVRFNRYQQDTLMSEHADHIQSIFDGTRKGIPILSCLCLLNDNFTGGELVMFGDTPIQFKKGDMMIFPSNFLYPHRVEPVISGIRYSCVAWVY